MRVIGKWFVVFMLITALTACGGADSAAATPNNAVTEAVESTDAALEATEITSSGDTNPMLEVTVDVDTTATQAASVASVDATATMMLINTFNLGITGAETLTLSNGVAQAAFTPPVEPDLSAVYTLLIGDADVLNVVEITFPASDEIGTYSFNNDGAAQAQVTIGGADAGRVYTEGAEGTLAINNLTTNTISGEFNFTISRSDGGQTQRINVFGLFTDVPIVR